MKQEVSFLLNAHNHSYVHRQLLRGTKFLWLLLLLIMVLIAATPVAAQDVADTVRIDTRVVFLDALVKDKRTGIPISDLTVENFEVFDDGKAREITYFTREGQARKPLALVIVLDLRDSGAGRFLKRPEILKAMIDELSKLSPEDEVAIMAMDLNGEEEKRLWLTGFTRDPQVIAAALARVPDFVAVQPEVADANVAKEKEQQKQETPAREDINKTTASAPASEQAEPTKEVVETEVIQGKNGAVLTRTTHKDGSIAVKRVNKKGNVTIEIDDIYDMAAAVREVTRTTQQQRPNSQASIVWISDGIAPIFFEDRDATQELLIRHNVIFNSLTVDLRTVFKLLLPIGKPIAGWVGLSLYGSAKKLAQQSGGEAISVKRVRDYSSGLSKIIGNLTARYSLGFSFAENEKDDSKLHSLELRVKAADAKGKVRKLLVSSRQGYYMSTTVGKEAKALPTQ